MDFYFQLVVANPATNYFVGCDKLTVNSPAAFHNFTNTFEF